MHTRHRTSAWVDGESLQADVMRFMAIIAFCLMAIMALVRDVNPPSVDQAAIEVAKPLHAPMPDAEPILTKRAEPAPNPTPVSAALTAPAPLEPSTLKPPTLKPPTLGPPPLKPPRLKPDTPKPQVPEPELSPPQETLVVASLPKSEPEEVESETSEQPEGLTLRFGTDRDFLRLIAKGDVGVYLFRDQEAYRLTKSYTFGPARPPHQLYELMPQTIPQAIRSAAGNSAHDLVGFRWGVAMPERIAARIERLVAVERSGQLVINRFGDVVHRASSKRLRAEG